MNPNLNRNEAYLRQGSKFFKPKDYTGRRENGPQFPSITQAKRHSRELMKQGHTIITKE